MFFQFYSGTSFPKLGPPTKKKKKLLNMHTLPLHGNRDKQSDDLNSGLSAAYLLPCQEESEADSREHEYSSDHSDRDSPSRERIAAAAVVCRQ